MSREHHQRCEIRMINAKNVTIYGFQSEEEKAEGEFALPIELHNCENITFATTYCFRTVFVQKPYQYCAKTYNCKKISFLNVHNYSQMKFTIDNFLLDVNSGEELRAWQAAKLVVTGNNENQVNEYSGFRFADGGCCDSKGNFYFLDSFDKRIYKIDGHTLNMTMIFESPYKVNSIGFDTEDNILVIAEYAIPKDAEVNGELIINQLPPDSNGTSYGFWYNSQAYVVAFTIKDGKMIPIEKVPMDTVNPKKVLYPGNRWRDSTDYSQVCCYNPGEAFLAPDNATIIPCHYDLIRSNNLANANVGEMLYSVDELYKRVWQTKVTQEGLLTEPTVVCEEGDYCVRHHNGKLYVGDDHIKVYENDKLVKTIDTPTRATTFDFGGDNKEILYVSARNKVYMY